MEENKTETPTTATQGMSKPSSIVPAKGFLEPARPEKAHLTGFAIEAVHIVIFIAILAIFYLGSWVKNNKV